MLIHSQMRSMYEEQLSGWLFSDSNWFSGMGSGRMYGLESLRGLTGQVLFTIYINEIPDIIGSACRIFADDTKLYTCSSIK